MFDDGFLDYYDSETNEKKGSINLKNVKKVELINKNKWIIDISTRIY